MTNRLNRIEKKLEYLEHLCKDLEKHIVTTGMGGGSISFLSDRTCIIDTILDGTELKMTLEAYDGQYHITFDDSTFTVSDVIEARVEIADILRTQGFKPDTIEMVKDNIELNWVEPETFEEIVESKMGY